PLVFAHRRVEPAFAVGLDLLTTRWPLSGPYEALQRIATGGGPLTQEHEIRAAERRLLALDRRLRLAEVFPANEVSLAASPEPEDAWLAWAIDGLAGREPPPAPGASAAWAHAEWRTRSALTPGARARAIAWGRERLGALLLAERPESQKADLLWAALILDSVELQDLADQSGEPLGGLGLAAAQYNLAARLAQAQPQSDEGLRLLLRAEALRPLVAGGRHHELIDPDWIGLRAAAAIALEEGELLMLRLPGPARSLFRRAADWYEAAGDLLGAWIAATGLALLSLSASIPPRFLASLVGRAERLYGELLAGSGDALGDDRLPPVSVLERLVVNPQGWLRDQFGPPLLRPWLLRLIACLAARADGDGPPHHATAFLNWLRAVPAPLLADWQPLVERAAADQGVPLIVRDEERPLSRRELRLALTELFSADELRLLCADIGMTYDDLPGATKGERVLALLARLEQVGRRDELVARMRRLRPAVDRAGPPAAPAPPDPPPSRDQLLDALLGGFNLPELRALAWDLGLDFQALPRGLGEASEEIVAQTAERRQLAELAQLILTERPTVPWGAPQPAPASSGLGALRAALVARFDSDELAGLADALGLALPAEAASRGDQIVALIGHARRRGRLAQLAQLVAQRGPEEAAEPAQSPAALVASADELRRRAAKLKPGRLVEVASDLAVDLEQLPGGEGPGLADELVRYLERRARLAELSAALADDLPRRGAERVGEPVVLRVKPVGRLATRASALDTHQVRLSFQSGAGALLYESPALVLSAGGEVAQAQQVLPDAARRELERDVAAARLAVGDYIQFLQELPQGLREEVAGQLKLGVARGQPGPLIVEAPPALHGAPWETLLALENSSASWADLRRTVRGRQPRRPPLGDDERVSVFLPGLDSVASVTARPAWEAMVREGAGRVSGWHSAASWAPALGSVRFQLIHLFGIVRETGRGLRLVLGAERGARAEGSAQPMSVENLARAYEDLALVVLQAPPLRGGSGRSAATRREAVLLRAFAASLHEAGVPVVLVLPAVAVGAAAELARRVTRVAVAPSAALPAEVRRLRTILPALVPDQPGDPEIVFDLTLFAPVDLGA
ncbi:MAG TPA: hypothetical protein PKD53_07585, partial [Chloroflexaceae bacterium]|nr:hypothetical protein [Chloroflexaceae bacterium]